MPTFDDVTNTLPQPLRGAVQGIWAGLSDQQRRELTTFLERVPGSPKTLSNVFDEVRKQWPAERKQRIAIIGPANVGKSTLYNQLILHKEDRARVGPRPGTTRANQQADTGLFTLVDTPGVDNPGPAGAAERAEALRAARQADLLVIMFDTERGIREGEKHLFAELVAPGKPYIVVLNKMDLVPIGARDEELRLAARDLGLGSATGATGVIGTAARDGQNVERVVLAAALAEPGLAPAIADELPEYRARLSWQHILRAAGAAASVALAPLPLADVIPLLGIQSGMVLSIARLYGFEITAARARELLATFGLGFAARTAFEELSKLGGVPGWILSASIATSTTVAMGYTAMIWFDRGERPTQEVMRRLTSEVTDYLREQFRDLRTRRPDRGTFRERVSQALKELPSRLRPPERA